MPIPVCVRMVVPVVMAIAPGTVVSLGIGIALRFVALAPVLVAGPIRFVALCVASCVAIVVVVTVFVAKWREILV